MGSIRNHQIKYKQAALRTSDERECDGQLSSFHQRFPISLDLSQRILFVSIQGKPTRKTEKFLVQSLHPVERCQPSCCILNPIELGVLHRDNSPFPTPFSHSSWFVIAKHTQYKQRMLIYRYLSILGLHHLSVRHQFLLFPSHLVRQVSKRHRHERRQSVGGERRLRRRGRQSRRHQRHRNRIFRQQRRHLRSTLFPRQPTRPEGLRSHRR